MSTTMRPWRIAVAGLVVGSFTLTACGSDTGSGDTATGSGSSSAPAESTIDDVVLDDEYSKQIAEASKVQVDTAAFKADGPYKLATITQGPINGWGTVFDVVVKRALADTGKVDMDELLYAAWNGKTENQTKAMDDAIAADVDGIILTSLSRAGLSASVDRATKAGIPVVTCMAGVDSDNYTAEVSRNIPDMGFQSAKAVAEKLGGQGKVVMLHGIAGVDAAEFWKAGAKAAFDAYPGIEIVAEQNGNWSTGDATNVMRTVVAQEPEIDAVWVGGFEMAQGVVNSFREAGKPVPFLGGTNAINGFLRLAQEEDLEFFVAPFPPVAAKNCVDVMMDVLAGEPVKKFTDVADVLEGTEPYDNSKLNEALVPELNDDFIGPLVYPAEVFAAEGFAKK